MSILLTFDIEDWFQVENFKEYISYDSWPERELRVEKNTHVLLDLLDEATGKRNDGQAVQATFFVLGWVAERCPALVEEIARRGHEVASHGFWHHLCYEQSTSELTADLRHSKEMLAEIIGTEIVGYRAPSFSVNDKVLQAIREAGYLYDSSYNSYEGHDRYGSLTLPSDQQRSAPLYTYPDNFFEIPVSNLQLGKRIVPWGGGGYFRLLPALLHRFGVRLIIRQQGSFIFYMHPWEIDPGQPRMHEAKSSFRFRHYINLGSARQKLVGLINSCVDQQFISCAEFIEKRGDGR